MGTGCYRWQINLVMHESFRIMKLIPTLLFNYYALEAVRTSIVYDSGMNALKLHSYNDSFVYIPCKMKVTQEMPIHSIQNQYKETSKAQYRLLLHAFIYITELTCLHQLSICGNNVSTYSKYLLYKFIQAHYLP